MTEENKVEKPVLWHVDIPENVREEFVKIGGRKLSIVAFGIKRASQFKPHDDNWRLHPKSQQRAVDGSLESLGWVDAPIENKSTGNLIDGHERIWNALKHNDGYVPYKQVELTEEEEVQALLTLDPISEMASTDHDKLKSLFSQMKKKEDNLNENIKECLNNVRENHGIFDIEEIDYEELWEGMPEFEQNEISPYKEIILRFMTEEDMNNFSELVNQTVTENTKSLWYPKQNFEQTNTNLRYG